MKKKYTYFILLIAVLFSSCSTSRNFSQDYQTQSSDITYQQFYNDLSPYGNWVTYRNYGSVWVPAEAGFRPYYNNGHWLYTNYGWTWVSNYNWGWAPFHYGRWLYDNAYGWMWMPGYEWAPAWVSWRSGGDYYGWAPLGPGMDFNMNVGSGLPYNYWSFVPHRYISNERINNYCVNSQRNVTIIKNTTIINNTTVVNNRRLFAGPSQSDVEKATHEKITPRKIVQRNTPGNSEISGSTVSIYKPSVREKEGQYEELKTGKVERLTEAKPTRTFDPVTNNVLTQPAKPTENQDGPVTRQKLNYPAAKEKPDNTTEQNIPVNETGRTFPSQKQQLNDASENLNREKNNTRQQENNDQNNKVPASKIIRQQDNQPGNVAPPANRQPAREQKNIPPPQTIQQQNYRQENTLHVNQPPVLRDQHPASGQESGQKESFRKKID